jgi:hypothetical protein
MTALFAGENGVPPRDDLRFSEDLRVEWEWKDRSDADDWDLARPTSDMTSELMSVWTMERVSDSISWSVVVAVKFLFTRHGNSNSRTVCVRPVYSTPLSWVRFNFDHSAFPT